MTYTYKTQGTCSSNIELDVEDGIVKEVTFLGVDVMETCKDFHVW